MSHDFRHTDWSAPSGDTSLTDCQTLSLRHIDDIESDEVAERAAEAIGGFRDADLSRRMGVARSTVARCTASEHVNTEVLGHLCREMRVNGDWLIFGEGELRRPRRPAGELGTLGLMVRELGKRTCVARKETSRRWSRVGA